MYSKHKLMDIINTEIVLHPRLLDNLFAHKGKVNSVFRDILGLYDIHHMAISYINSHRMLSVHSSTPAIEFNLFSSELWHFDKTYHASWYRLCLPSLWHTLYLPARYDELFYVKQVKHQYPLGLSFAVKSANNYLIYSIATHKNSPQTRDIFANFQDDFHRIGRYCSNALAPLFEESEGDQALEAAPS